MSIPAIPTHSAAVRAPATAVDRATPTQAPARSASTDETTTTTTTASPAQTQEAEDKPVTVHFPWLSRLSQKLEAASNKRPTFPNPIIGDNLNKKA